MEEEEMGWLKEDATPPSRPSNECDYVPWLRVSSARGTLDAQVEDDVVLKKQKGYGIEVLRRLRGEG